MFYCTIFLLYIFLEEMLFQSFIKDNVLFLRNWLVFFFLMGTADGLAGLAFLGERGTQILDSPAVIVWDWKV